MIDVLMIMLIFFMVTSTFLNLRMMPLAQPGTQAAQAPGPESDALAARAAPLFVRLDADGRAHLRGRPLDPAWLRAAMAEAPPRQVVILPSARAPLQSLVSLTETLRAAGVRRLAIIRPEGAP
jgi:biopolymer transport protein ExbD